MEKQIHCVDEKRLYPIEDQSRLLKNVLASTPATVSTQREEEELELPDPVPFQQVFSVDVAGASSVALAHSFNSWKPDINMKREGGSRWSASVTMPAHAAGSKVYFKFVINGKDWAHQPAYGTETDAHGHINNVLQLPS